MQAPWDTKKNKQIGRAQLLGNSVGIRVLYTHANTSSIVGINPDYVHEIKIKGLELKLLEAEVE